MFTKQQKQRLKERIERKIKRTRSGCWIWQGATVESNSRCKYGYIYINGRLRTVRRISYEIYKGPLGDSTVICTCSNPACVAPDHLLKTKYRKSHGPRRRRVDE